MGLKKIEDASKPIKIGPRMPKLIEQYCIKVAKEKNLTKYEFMLNCIGENLPLKLSDIMDKETYESLISDSIQAILNLQFESAEFADVIRGLLITPNSAIVANNLIDIVYKDIDSIEKNNIVKLLTFKDSFIKEVIVCIMSNPQIKKKYEESVMNFYKTLSEFN